MTRHVVTLFLAIEERDVIDSREQATFLTLR